MATERKDDLLKELHEIQRSELADKVTKMGYSQTAEQKNHNFVMRGDFLIKFLMAVAVSSAFIYIVYTGNVEAMEGAKGFSVGAGAGNFQLLSVVGPLFGMVMSYYFGKSKAGANGE